MSGSSEGHKGHHVGQAAGEEERTMNMLDVTLGPHRCSFWPWKPADGRLFHRFAFDAETTVIDDERPYLTPAYVLGAATDGQRGVFVSRETLRDFFAAHDGAGMIAHNAPFDL